VEGKRPKPSMGDEFQNPDIDAAQFAVVVAAGILK